MVAVVYEFPKFKVLIFKFKLKDHLYQANELGIICEQLVHNLIKYKGPKS